MSLKREIAMNYTDANGLVSPRKCFPTEVNPSGNNMYTSELILLLRLTGELAFSDVDHYTETMNKCFIEPGLMVRGPNQTDIEGPDDYYALAAACRALSWKSKAEQVIKYGWEHFGSFNNIEPGKWTFQSFLWRQPQLLCAFYAAARRAPLWIYPLRLYTAAVIALSCRNTSIKNQDAWRLTWLLVHTMWNASWICRQAGRSWFRRLYAAAPGGMAEVGKGYYEDGHPYLNRWPHEQWRMK